MNTIEVVYNSCGAQILIELTQLLTLREGRMRRMVCLIGIFFVNCGTFKSNSLENPNNTKHFEYAIEHEPQRWKNLQVQGLASTVTSADTIHDQIFLLDHVEQPDYYYKEIKSWPDDKGIFNNDDVILFKAEDLSVPLGCFGPWYYALKHRKLGKIWKARQSLKHVAIKRIGRRLVVAISHLNAGVSERQLNKSGVTILILNRKNIVEDSAEIELPFSGASFGVIQPTSVNNDSFNFSLRLASNYTFDNRKVDPYVYDYASISFDISYRGKIESINPNIQRIQ